MHSNFKEWEIKITDEFPLIKLAMTKYIGDLLLGEKEIMIH